MSEERINDEVEKALGNISIETDYTEEEKKRIIELLNKYQNDVDGGTKSLLFSLSKLNKGNENDKRRWVFHWAI